MFYLLMSLYFFKLNVFHIGFVDIPIFLSCPAKGFLLLEGVAVHRLLHCFSSCQRALASKCCSCICLWVLEMLGWLSTAHHNLPLLWCYTSRIPHIWFSFYLTMVLLFFERLNWLGWSLKGTRSLQSSVTKHC